MDIIKSIAVRCLDEGSSTAENRGDFMTVSRRPLLLGLSFFAFAGGASAQEAGIEGASPDYGDEIVVTARKRTETVQDVPTSIRRSEEHTSELQSLMRISYAVFCLKKKKNENETSLIINTITHRQN